MGQDWRKSSFSDGNGCLEWKHMGDLTLVRDSKVPDGPVLTFTAHEWRVFVRGVREGEADRGD